MIKGKPFVKWAGGKRQVIDKLKLYAPDEYNTYYEPFVGGGALLFELSPRKAVINDYNEELMNIFMRYEIKIGIKLNLNEWLTIKEQLEQFI